MIIKKSMLISIFFLSAVFCAKADMADDLKAKDTELNQIYQKILKKTENQPKLQLLFKKSEQAWINYKLKDLNIFSTLEGTARSLAINSRAIDLTNERIKILKFYLNCPEGDIYCVIN